MRIRKAVALMLLLTLAACKDTQLRDLVNASDKVADTTLIIQKAAVDAENAGTLTRNQTRFIMETSIRVLTANDKANNIARDLSKLDAPSRAQLLSVLTPIIAEVNKAIVDPNITGIQNANVRNSITASFQAVQASLNSINLILATAK